MIWFHWFHVLLMTFSIRVVLKCTFLKSCNENDFALAEYCNENYATSLYYQKSNHDVCLKYSLAAILNMLYHIVTSLSLCIK